MNLAPDTLSDEVEPYLLRSELLIRTPRGRVATAKTYRHLALEPGGGDVDDGQGKLF
jgi:Holliday junction DNA helicase RuvB